MIAPTKAVVDALVLYSASTRAFIVEIHENGSPAQTQPNQTSRRQTAYCYARNQRLKKSQKIPKFCE